MTPLNHLDHLSLLTEFDNHFQLRKTIKFVHKKNKVLVDELNSVKKLEKRLDVLKRKPDNKKWIKEHKKLSKELDDIKNSQAYRGNLIDKDVLYRKYNLKKLKRIGDGYTSYIFDSPIDKNKIVGFTVDNQKIKWLNDNKKEFQFHLIDTIKITVSNNLYVYTMKKIETKFTKLSKKHQQILMDEVISKYFDLRKKKGFNNVTIKDLDYIMYNITDIELKTILEKLKKTFSNTAILDLHQNQWGEDSGGNLLLIDPVFSNKPVNEIEDFNTLDIKTQFSLLVNNLFNESNSKEAKAILKKIRK